MPPDTRLRGLVAGHQQRHAEALQVGVGEQLPVDLGRHEHAHEVVARVLAPVTDDVPEVVEQLGGQDENLVARVGGGVDHGVRPDAEALAVLGGDAHELGDDEEGQRRSHALDDVERLPRFERVEHPDGQLAHPLLEGGHAPGGECRADQPPVALVVGRVEEEDGVGTRDLPATVGGQHALARAERRRVA